MSESPEWSTIRSKAVCCKHCTHYKPDEHVKGAVFYCCEFRRTANPKKWCRDFQPDLTKLCHARDEHVERLREILDLIEKMEVEA